MRAVLVLFVITVGVGRPAVAGHTPTIDDVYALKGTSRIAASPDGALIAIEAEKGIIILNTHYPFTQLQLLKGSDPKWSSNGDNLAFYVVIDGKNQIEVWNRKLDSLEQITHLPGGIDPNPSYFAYGGDSRWFTWSPDSTHISFCSRPSIPPEAQTPDESPSVRILTKDTTYADEMDGVFRTDFWQAKLNDLKRGYHGTTLERTRAIDKHPELGLNKVFVVDVKSKTLRQLTSQIDQHFFPSWSPDGRTLIAIVDLDRFAVDRTLEFPGYGPLHTALAVFNVENGEEKRVTTPLPLNGPPQWSPDGSKIAVISRQRYLGFPRVQLFSWSEQRWSSLTAPKGMAVVDIKWATDRRSLLVRTADRFVNTLWLIDPATSRAKQIDTTDLDITAQFDEANGDLFFTASSATYTGRVFKTAVAAVGHVQQLYDPDPALSQLQFGQQKRVTWTNKAGEEVDGILIFPPDYQATHPYPILIDLYPAPARDGFHLSFGQLGQIEAARGYVVFLPSLRSPHGPTVYSRDEEYNEKARGAKGIPIMVDDFTSGIEYLVRRGIAAPNRIGIYGHSNGGYMVNFLITETNIAQCAVVWAGASNFTYEAYFVPTWVHEIGGGSIYDKFSEFVELSPLFRMNRVRTPLLMVVGDKDWNTWLPEMLMQFNALKQLGKDVTMVRYPDEGHSFDKPEDQRDFIDRMNDFFDQHLRPREQPAFHSQ
jgi:dipeptidyl aminopeptidase/acylaminoacyl peptidase